MARPIATNRVVGRDELLAFVRERTTAILATRRRDGRPQLSPVTMGVGPAGDLLVASYPERVKVRNARRDAAVSVCVVGPDLRGEWVQIDGLATVVDLPDAVDVLVDYFRSISGEHPDWDEYRQAMVDQGKCALRISVDHWGPISKGGFPAHLADR